MSFFIEKEVECNFNFDYEKVAEAVVSASLEHESFPYEAEVNLTLTDNEGIHAINKEYRQIDRPTDVLSFPMLSYERPEIFLSFQMKMRMISILIQERSCWATLSYPSTK